jgi:hypothetical protein
MANRCLSQLLKLKPRFDQGIYGERYALTDEGLTAKHDAQRPAFQR